MIHRCGVVASMRPTPAGSVPLQPRGTSAHAPFPLPVVRVPGTAITLDHMSMTGSRKYLPPVSMVERTTGPLVRSTHAVE